MSAGCVSARWYQLFCCHKRCTFSTVLHNHVSNDWVTWAQQLTYLMIQMSCCSLVCTCMVVLRLAVCCSHTSWCLEISSGKKYTQTLVLHRCWQQIGFSCFCWICCSFLFTSYSTQLPTLLQLIAFCVLTTFFKTVKYKNSPPLISAFLPLVLLSCCCAVPRTASCWKYVSPVERSCVTPSWQLHVHFYFPLCDNVAPTPPCVFPFNFIL